MSLCPCRADRTLHTHSCHETTGRPAPKVGLSSVWHLPAGLTVSCRHCQVFLWFNGCTLSNGHSRAPTHQYPVQDGSAGQEVEKRSREVSNCNRHWNVGFIVLMTFTRFLDPDPPSLLAEVGKNMSSKYHRLNVAITTLVNNNNVRTACK